ncbi:uncharacterized protein B0H64DRAFT_421034 [Chaetomium fimeti]|uniref:Uncharacterized protein n=1 Tax=Chaetomium fimeti TaxID=1854472 RepID=A0AAE0LMN0_9PEZI|nr:hypothetical protein B0H64DRAFT_421034 [Chaetomium fimeti]
MPSATPQPQLKKKASFRDRLKAWQKPPQPLEIVTEESKPRFVYEPTHAAADFSRLAVSPLSPVKPRLSPATTHTPPERDTPTSPRSGQPRPRDKGEPRDHESTRRHSRPSVNRHSYTLVEDPFQASNAAAHVPVNPQPVEWSPGAAAASAKGGPPPTQSSPQPLSDFELFLARAEAEDRERRDRVLRSISQRSAAYTASRIRPDPHRQFAAAGSSAAERTVRRPAEKDESLAQRNTKTRHVHAPSGKTEAEQQQPRKLEQRQERDHRGHARQSSWAASYTADGSAREKGPAALSPTREIRPLPEPPLPVRADGAGEDMHQPPAPRTLRRQASITQRIVQYIRPPKTGARPIQTLVE